MHQTAVNAKSGQMQVYSGCVVIKQEKNSIDTWTKWQQKKNGKQENPFQSLINACSCSRLSSITHCIYIVQCTHTIERHRHSILLCGKLQLTWRKTSFLVDMHCACIRYQQQQTNDEPMNAERTLSKHRSDCLIMYEHDAFDLLFILCTDGGDKKECLDTPNNTIDYG